MKIVKVEEIEKRIRNKFPEAHFAIVSYIKTRKPITVKCLDCGEEKTFANLCGILNRKAFCLCYSNCGQAINKRHKQGVLRILDKKENLQFISFSRRYTKKDEINVLCKNCNQVFSKVLDGFIKNQKCPFCESRHDLNTKGFQKTLPKEYTLIGEYVDGETKVLVRHECGFIWKVRPHFLRGYEGCPKCNRKISKGERRIINYLQGKQIAFEPEKIFSFSSNPRFRYDFYLPDYNLVIEYMGEQHYREVAFLHDTLSERQERDEIKKKEVLEQKMNYLAISYKDFNNISDVLDKWFNDYLKEGKA